MLSYKIEIIIKRRYVKRMTGVPREAYDTRDVFGVRRAASGCDRCSFCNADGGLRFGARSRSPTRRRAGCRRSVGGTAHAHWPARTAFPPPVGGVRGRDRHLSATAAAAAQ